MQLLIKNTQADVTTIQKTKLNQSHKTPSIPHFSQPNTTNISPIKQKNLKIYLYASQQLHIENMYIPPKHSTQLSQTEEDSIISSTFTAIINLPSTIRQTDSHILFSHKKQKTKNGKVTISINNK